jgi:hypothetical protein
LDDRPVRIAGCGINPATLPLVDACQVQTLFDAVSHATCPLPNASPECVPFLFPDNGCWARAHAMCNQLRDEHRVTAGKAWLYGDLCVATRNHRSGHVAWDNHVAPIVRSGETADDLMVLDPSVFSGPTTLAAWQHAIVKEDSRPIITKASIYTQFAPRDCAREEDGELVSDLKYFQACLLARARGLPSPPPYARAVPCP